jgi:RNA ligase (TIGR02306 family)
LERRLAHIETIREVIPHGNADSLEIVKILGWTCCVLKGQFKANDRVVFIEPDAILPEGKSDWEFMRQRGFRIKTIKLRGVISQGLVFHLNILPPPIREGEQLLGTSNGISTSISFVSGYFEGQDVTELLGITKYEPYVPAQLAGQVKGSFPEFLYKTDEIRIQAVPELLEKHQGKKFYVTEKLDGSSMTVYLNNGEFGVCSRNMDLKETEGNAYWKVARELKLEEIMGFAPARSDYIFPINFALQGELIGMGVQSNKYKLSGLEFRIFNVFDIAEGRCLDYQDFIEVAERLELKTVPQLGTVILNTFKTVDEIVEFSKGQSILNKNVPREGIVLRPLVEEYSEELHGRLSFKIINPLFLLKFEE